MFDFEKLDVYKKSKELNKLLRQHILEVIKLDASTHSQLNRAALSVMLNIAEGSGRFTSRDKRNFYIIARGSLFECVALCDFLLSQRIIDRDIYLKIYDSAEEISKMLFAMINKLGKTD